ncbi:fumarylacetoacetate hydrolase family protein [Sphingomonas oligophenolica]|uniref:Fumarylacetoacetate hydrolase family protein n=1 Tax=Sphingomonas oligophenolica TaxID=301154 RepID=A0ABU9Y975_9SPHN
MTEAAHRWAVEPAPRPSVAVSDGSAFPVRRIWCVGRNYSDHAREMGGDPDREPPFFFAKPADAVVADGSILPFPAATGDLHHEVELAVAIGQAGFDLSPEQALAAIFGYAVALDMTRRDLQAEAKKAARPWDMGKGFDRSCPIGALRPAAEIGNVIQGAIRLVVNDTPRQEGDIADMIWTPAECVAALSRLVELAPGDLILTGTPAGVGPVHRGDRLRASIDGVGSLSITYAGSPC